MFGVALTTALLRVQLTNGRIIFDHESGANYTLLLYININSYVAIWRVMFHFVTRYIFELHILYLLKLFRLSIFQSNAAT